MKRKKISGIKISILPLWFLCILCTICGCMSMVEKTGRFLDGSASENKQVSLYRANNVQEQTNIDISIVKNKKQEQSLLVSMSKFPMIKFRTSFPVDDGTFYFTSLEYLSGSAQGWNEYSLDLLGVGSFKVEDQAIFSITENIEPIQISKGRIQRFDTRIVGNEALTALRNRRERILALTEWMSNQSFENLRDSTSFASFASIEEFETFWGPILFPEIVSKKEKPEKWHQERDVFKRAEDILWNTGYSERYFPEELRPIRDSGTLFRDWEEALPWIYLEYEWDNIIELLSNQIILQKIK